MSAQREREAAERFGVSVEEVREVMRRFYAKVREQMRLMGYENVPDTEEGLLFVMEQEGMIDLILEITAEKKPGA